VSEYQPRHARPEPEQLPWILRGLADKIEIIGDDE
jgi:hypothetical protein